MSKKVLLATEKPFVASAVEGIEGVFAKAGYELVKLENYTDTADLLAAVADVDAMIIRSDKATAQVIEAASNLRIIVRAGAGFDNIDLAAATAHDVCAMNTPGQNANAVAELAVGMMLYMARNKFTKGSGTELRGKRIGIHAYGNVGKYVALIAKGFGMSVSAFDPFIPAEAMEADGVTVCATVEELYETCDYVSLHMTANGHTKRSINHKRMGRMKEGATLINTARKEVVCEDGLKMIMAERPGFRYSTDVAPDCHGELLEKYGLRYFFTPKKMGAQTAEANINAGVAAATQIVNFFEKGDRNFQVN